MLRAVTAAASMRVPHELHGGHERRQQETAGRLAGGGAAPDILDRVAETSETTKLSQRTDSSSVSRSAAATSPEIPDKFAETSETEVAEVGG